MKSDIPIKRLLQVKPDDWIHFLLPDIDILESKELNTVLVAKLESRIDNLHLINNKFILHIEPNGYKDEAMPARMLRYRADIWEHTIKQGMGTPSIEQVLILFFKKHDNEQHELHDISSGKATINYNYRVIRIWELSEESIIYKKLTGLYPLLPIMKHNESETPDKILAKSVEMAFTIQDSVLRADILSAMAILAEGKFSEKLIANHIRREMFVESVLFQEWTREAKEEGKIEGKIEGTIENKIETAQKMMKLGYENTIIAYITELSIDKIIDLKKQMDN